MAADGGQLAIGARRPVRLGTGRTRRVAAPFVLFSRADALPLAGPTALRSAYKRHHIRPPEPNPIHALVNDTVSIQQNSV